MAGSSEGRLQRLAGQIVEAARQDGLQPGSRLLESRLAQRLGVSRGPVRGGLRRLEAVGLAAQSPNRGYVLVRPLDDVAALQIIDEAEHSESHYMAIADDRLDGRLPDAVSEQEMMRRYGLRRPELRRLLDRIAGEGWIARLPGYGWKFAPTLSSPDAYAQSTRLRLMIEPAAMLEPGFALGPGVAERLRQQQRRVLAGEERFTMAEIFRLGCDFHEALAEASGNPFVLDVLRRINSVRRLFAYRALMPDRETVRRQSGEHIELIGLIEDGRRDEAVAFMRRHLHDALAQACKPRDGTGAAGSAPGAAPRPSRPRRRGPTSLPAT